MKHRLREIRKSKRLSQQKFGEMIEEAIHYEDKWPYQKVSRLENYETDLTHTMIFQICKTFTDIQPWEFFIHPDDLYPSQHKEVVSAYLALDDEDRRIVDKFLFGQKNQAPLSAPAGYALHDKDDDDTIPPDPDRARRWLRGEE